MLLGRSGLGTRVRVCRLAVLPATLDGCVSFGWHPTNTRLRAFRTSTFLLRGPSLISERGGRQGGVYPKEGVIPIRCSDRDH
jgi:hypothetical protein